MTKEQLEDKLYARVEQENEAYLAEIKTKPVDEIIANASLTATVVLELTK